MEEYTEEEKRLKDLLGQVKDLVDAVAKQQRQPGQKYVVYVDDNFNFMDGDERYKLGEFDTEEEAVQAAKAVIDKSLGKGCGPNDTPESILQAYQQYGEDPYIPGSSFSAWDYARERCKQLCEKKNAE